ncbi:hypothetical protein H0H92_001802 [Tricholoma furcatifolium]|nr:hypothetical protein H0H92_001802 [Tricholoma furcatifolium]
MMLSDSVMSLVPSLYKLIVMITLGVNAQCDNCLQSFDRENKAPSAIACGHVFCYSCIAYQRTVPLTTEYLSVDYKPCPSCGTTFDTRQILRLHIDLDVDASQPTQPNTVPAADRETLTLFSKMVALADDSSSEVELRNGLDTVMRFAQQHQQSIYFSALYTCSRLLTYVIDVRAKERGHVADKTMLEAHLTRLREEREALERTAREDREMALFIQTSLREHAKSAQESYESMIKLTPHRIVDDIRNICHSLQYRDNPRSRSSNLLSTRDLASQINERLVSYHDAPVRRDEHVTDPENVLVSPLSTLSALPSQTLTLPDEAPIEPAPRKQKRRPRSSTCHNRGHPAGCTCAVDYTEPSRTPHRSSEAIYDRLSEREREREPYAPDTPTGYGRDRKRQSSPRPRLKSKAARDHSTYSCEQPSARDPSPYGREQATTGQGSPYRREETTGCDRSFYGCDVIMQSYNDDTRSARSAGSMRESRQQTTVTPSSHRPFEREGERKRKSYVPDAPPREGRGRNSRSPLRLRRHSSPHGHEQTTTGRGRAYSLGETTDRERRPCGRDLTIDDTRSASSWRTDATRGYCRQIFNPSSYRDRSPYGRDRPHDFSPYGHDQSASLYNNDEEIGSSRSTDSTSGPQRQGPMSLKSRSPTPRPPSPAPHSQSFKICSTLQGLLSEDMPTGSSSQLSSSPSGTSMLHDSPRAVSDQLTPLVGDYSLPESEPELIAGKPEAHQEEPLCEVQDVNNLSPATREEELSRPIPATHIPPIVPPHNAPLVSASGTTKARLEERKRAEHADRMRDEELKRREDEERETKRQGTGSGQTGTRSTLIWSSSRVKKSSDPDGLDPVDPSHRKVSGYTDK